MLPSCFTSGIPERLPFKAGFSQGTQRGARAYSREPRREMAPNNGRVFLLRGFGCRQREWVSCEHTPVDTSVDSEQFQLDVEPSFYEISSNVRVFPSNWHLDDVTGAITLRRSNAESVQGAPKSSIQKISAQDDKSIPQSQPLTPSDIRSSVQPTAVAAVAAAAVAAVAAAPVKLEQPVPARKQPRLDNVKNIRSTKPKPPANHPSPNNIPTQPKLPGSDVPIIPRTKPVSLSTVKIEQPVSGQVQSSTERAKDAGSTKSRVPVLQTASANASLGTSIAEANSQSMRKPVPIRKDINISRTGDGGNSVGNKAQHLVNSRPPGDYLNVRAGVDNQGVALPMKRHSNEPDRIRAEHKRMKTSKSAQKQVLAKNAVSGSRTVVADKPSPNDVTMSNDPAAPLHSTSVGTELGQKFVLALLDNFCHYARNSSVLMPRKLKDKHVYLDEVRSQLPQPNKPNLRNQAPAVDKHRVDNVSSFEPLDKLQTLAQVPKDSASRVAEPGVKASGAKSRDEAEKEFAAVQETYKRWNQYVKLGMEVSSLRNDSVLFERIATFLSEKAGYRFIRADLVLSHLVEFPNCTKCISELTNILEVLDKKTLSPQLDDVMCVLGHLTQYALALSTRVYEIFGGSLKATRDSPRAAKIVDAYSSFTTNCEEMKSKDGEFLASILKRLYSISFSVSSPVQGISKKLQAIGNNSKQTFNQLKLIFTRMKGQVASSGVPKTVENKADIARSTPASNSRVASAEQSATGRSGERSSELNKRTGLRPETIEASGQVSRRIGNFSEVIEVSGRIPRRSGEDLANAEHYSIPRRDDSVKKLSPKVSGGTLGTSGSRIIPRSQNLAKGSSSNEMLNVPKLPIPHANLTTKASSSKMAFLSSRATNGDQQCVGDAAQNGQPTVPRSAPPRLFSKPASKKQSQPSKPSLLSKPLPLSNGFSSIRGDGLTNRQSKPAPRKVLRYPGVKKNKGQRTVNLPSQASLETIKLMQGYSTNPPRDVLETLFTDNGVHFKSSLLDSSNTVQNAAIAERAEQMTFGSVVSFYGMVREYVRATMINRRHQREGGEGSVSQKPDFIEVPDVRELERMARYFKENRLRNERHISNNK